MPKTKQMKALEEMLNEKRSELERLKIEIATLEDAMSRAKGEPSGNRQKRAPRSNVKLLVLNMLEEQREKGLNAGLAVKIAVDRGQHLERGTVSSLLSRLKNDHTVTYDGTVYVLGKYSENKTLDGEIAESSSVNVLTHPASRTAQ